MKKEDIDDYRKVIIPHFEFSLKLKNAINPQHFEQMLQFKGTQTFITLSRDPIPGLHNNIVLVAINVWLTIIIIFCSQQPQGHRRQTHFTEHRSSTLGQYMSVLVSTVLVEAYQCSQW